jgi:hypothetical protein
MRALQNRPGNLPPLAKLERELVRIGVVPPNARINVVRPGQDIRRRANPRAAKRAAVTPLRAAIPVLERLRHVVRVV